MTRTLIVADQNATLIHCVTPQSWEAMQPGFSVSQQAFLAASGFSGKSGSFALVPCDRTGIDCVLYGFDVEAATAQTLFSFGKLATQLPAGTYALPDSLAPESAHLAAFAFASGQYQFSRYRSEPFEPRQLTLPKGVDAARLSAELEASSLVRDLINTPANDCGPAEIMDAVKTLGKRHGASVKSIEGKALEKGFPLIHAVGHGSPRRPRLVELNWGKPKQPLIVLVGKGVAFDTGGLDIKPSASMLTMKKDMGGAANILGLAHMIMAAGLKVRLRVLIATVENAVSGEAFRPGDVFRSRKGLSVEIGNTDAEGRLILADALHYGDEDKPELMVDFATLTGAARVALGPEVPPFFTADDALASELQSLAMSINDPLWRMPLWAPYMSALDSKIADLNNAAPGLPGMAGSITAALFLSRFVEQAKAWLHCDIFAWTPSDRPGRPQGAEMQAARALFTLIANKYGA